MPSLEEILKKTKEKSEQVKIVRKPPSIATEDRPYSLAETISIQPKETSNQVETKVATNQQQTGNKREVQNTNWQQSGITTGNTISNKVATNQQQTSNKLATNSLFSELVGLQRDIIIFICHECKNSRSRVTEALTLEHIAMSLERNAGAIKTTLQRLEKKGCLMRVGFKNGRGGWSKYELPDSIYHDVIRNETSNKVTTNQQQSGNKVASQLATELATSASSSSSNNINTTTTELSQEWNFDISPYHQFGFTISQLKQLASIATISAADVEQSLVEFSYDFDNNALPPIKTNKINFLMGLLRGGHAYVSANYRNQHEQAVKLMAERAIQRKKAQLEEKFVAWESELSQQERQQIVSTMSTNLTVLYNTYGLNNSEVKNWFVTYYQKQCYT